MAGYSQVSHTLLRPGKARVTQFFIFPVWFAHSFSGFPIGTLAERKVTLRAAKSRR